MILFKFHTKIYEKWNEQEKLFGFLLLNHEHTLKTERTCLIKIQLINNNNNNFENTL